MMHSTTTEHHSSPTFKKADWSFNKQKSHLVFNLPVVLLAALAVVPVHFDSVLSHQQQVFDKGLKVQLAQDHTLQLAAP